MPVYGKFITIYTSTGICRCFVYYEKNGICEILSRKEQNVKTLSQYVMFIRLLSLRKVPKACLGTSLANVLQR